MLLPSFYILYFLCKKNHTSEKTAPLRKYSQDNRLNEVCGREKQKNKFEI